MGSHHCQHNITLEEAIEKLKEGKLKVTPKRKEILEIFAEDNRYRTPQQIHSILAEDHPTMSYNTTYRNIYDFEKLGILESTEYNQEQLFRMACSQGHHHHFICTNCGQVIPLHVCPLDQITDDLKDVEVHYHRFEVFGLCPNCKD
ncbi:Fur family transcriptional regulator [Hutsoniella sourekii]|uniref:Fur family transcriptional regulator n=1 Tax=Hutsoniella sourekii TaxID=87650 RepID=UPI0004AD20A5|nr:Fur family transcriptional regulator [Hutsoniella sourekii]